MKRSPIVHSKKLPSSVIPHADGSPGTPSQVMLTVLGSTPVGRRWVTTTPSAGAGPMLEMVSVNVAVPAEVRVVGPSTSTFKSAPEVMPRSRRNTTELKSLSRQSAMTILSLYILFVSSPSATATGPTIAPLNSIGRLMSVAGNINPPSSLLTTFEMKYSVFVCWFTDAISTSPPPGSWAMFHVIGKPSSTTS